MHDILDLYRGCRVCPRRCGVNRIEGELGWCGMPAELVITAAVPHFGEEPPLNGPGGAGNIFTAGCNLSCVYCQNYQASQFRIGRKYSYEGTADLMLKLQDDGVDFIGWVSPSHYIPSIALSTIIAQERGLKIPIIYNTNSYDSVESLRMLEGLADIYLADLRYSDNAFAEKYSGVSDYTAVSRSAVEEMFRQVGELRINNEGLAEKGLIIRHLVLPGGISGSWETLCFIALELSKEIPVSIMSQYIPVHKAGGYPEIDRTINEDEYSTVIKMAEDLGFTTIYAQNLHDCIQNLPDFTKAEPFPIGRCIDY